MQRVSGISGIFFRAKDPERLYAWYEDVFGITRAPRDYGSLLWEQRAGPAVFAAFPQDTEYFRNPKQAWMINFRVDDLDAMVVQLRAKGIEVAFDTEIYLNERFAKLNDPKGNPIELWQLVKT